MRRFHVPADLKHKYQLYPPSGSNGWRVFRVEAGMPRKTVKNKSIVVVNEQFRAGTLTKDQAREQLQLVIEGLYKADGVKVSRVQSNSINEALLKRYIEEKINRSSESSPSSKQAAANYATSAVRALGEHSLVAADRDTLQSALNERYPDHRQRRMVTALNSIFKWMKRDVVLEQFKYTPPDVKYIPFDKIGPVLDRLPSDAWRVCVQMALYSGLRIGELFALEKNHKKKWGIFVQWQILRDGKKGLPKNGKTRQVAVFSKALELFDKWTLLKHEISLNERKRASRIVMSACKRAYTNRSDLHLCFHDLRHSYAIAGLEHGLSLEWIAKQLGNAIEVTEEHYIGHVQTSAMEEAAFKLLNKVA